MLSPGTLFENRYEIQELLGEGGSGIVYKALQVAAKRTVALKLMHAAHFEDEENLKRFRREARILAKLQHQNIVTFYHFGITEGDCIPYAVMEYLRGKNLKQVLDQSDLHLSPQRAVHIIKQVCNAISFAHESGVYHRDIKPGNIILIEKPEADTVKLIDFGFAKLNEKSDLATAKLTKTGLLIGSLHYMSPEQCTGIPIDQRSDIYSCGTILFEMLTGQKPFECDNPVGLLYKVRTEMPAAFSATKFGGTCPQSYELICRKALAKAPENRYQDMKEMISDLEKAERGSSDLIAATFSEEPEPDLCKSHAPKKQKSINISSRTMFAATCVLIISAVAVVALQSVFYTKKHILSTVLDVAGRSEALGTVVYLHKSQTTPTTIYLGTEDQLLPLTAEENFKFTKGKNELHLGSICQVTYTKSLAPNEPGKILKCKIIADDQTAVEIATFTQNILQNIYAESPYILTDYFSAEYNQQPNFKSDYNNFFQGIGNGLKRDASHEYSPIRLPLGDDFGSIIIPGFDLEKATAVVDRSKIDTSKNDFLCFQLSRTENSWQINSVQLIPAAKIQDLNELKKPSKATSLDSKLDSVESCQQLFQEGRTELALFHITNLLLKDPDNLAAIKLSAEVNYAAFEYNQCLYDCDKLIQRLPNESWAFAKRALVLSHTDNPKSCFTAIQRAKSKALQSDQLENLQLLEAEILLRMDRDNEALAVITQTRPSIQRKLIEARIQLALKHPDIALQLFNSIEPKQLDLATQALFFASRGLCYSESNDFTKAIADIDQSIKLTSPYLDSETVKDAMSKSIQHPSMSSLAFKQDCILRSRNYALMNKTKILLKTKQIPQAIETLNSISECYHFAQIRDFYLAKIYLPGKDWRLADQPVNRIIDSLYEGYQKRMLWSDAYLLMAILKAKEGGLESTAKDFYISAINSYSSGFFFTEYGDVVESTKRSQFYDPELRKEAEHLLGIAPQLNGPR